MDVDAAHDVLERFAGDPARHQVCQVVLVRGRGREVGGLLLGEHAPCRTQDGDDLVVGRVGTVWLGTVWLGTVWLGTVW
ncbi:MAG: hypothetical protein ACTHW7_03735, partial [Actinomycetaceae bacterium]